MNLDEEKKKVKQLWHTHPSVSLNAFTFEMKSELSLTQIWSASQMHPNWWRRYAIFNVDCWFEDVICAAVASILCHDSLIMSLTPTVQMHISAGCYFGHARTGARVHFAALDLLFYGCFGFSDSNCWRNEVKLQLTACLMCDRWPIERFRRSHSKTHWTRPENFHASNEFLVFVPTCLLHFLYVLTFIQISWARSFYVSDEMVRCFVVAIRIDLNNQQN